MADRQIDPHELKRQRSRRERQRNAARRKGCETNLDADPSSAEPADWPANNKPKFKESDMTGLKYFDKLAPLLERLHDDACQRNNPSAILTVTHHQPTAAPAPTRPPSESRTAQYWV